jgi:hypothetical protein
MTHYGSIARTRTFGNWFAKYMDAKPDIRSRIDDELRLSVHVEFIFISYENLPEDFNVHKREHEERPPTLDQTLLPATKPAYPPVSPCGDRIECHASPKSHDSTHCLHQVAPRPVKSVLFDSMRSGGRKVMRVVANKTTRFEYFNFAPSVAGEHEDGMAIQNAAVYIFCGVPATA